MKLSILRETVREVESAPPDGEAGPRAWRGPVGVRTRGERGEGEGRGRGGGGPGWPGARRAGRAGQACAPITATTEMEVVGPTWSSKSPR